PEPDVHLPPAVKTEAWGRRVLGSQLASWAELRRDTILYVKQSYSSVVIGCSYPDAYVDPYPAFYARLARLAHQGPEPVQRFHLGRAGDVEGRVRAYFDRVAQTADRLRRIAESQARTPRLSKDDVAWMNEAVVEHPATFRGGCGGSTPRFVQGWYADLFFD